MPCLPGFLPVMNEVHAGGVIGGRIDSSLPDTPAFTNFARFGMPPSAIHGRMSVHVAASNPMIITFGSFFISRADYVDYMYAVFAKFWLSGGVGIKSFIHAPRLHPSPVKPKINDSCVHRTETLSDYVALVKRTVEHHVAAPACPGDLAANGASLAGFRVKLVNVRRGNARSHLLLLQPALVKHVSETIEVSEQ